MGCSGALASHLQEAKTLSAQPKAGSEPSAPRSFAHWSCPSCLYAETLASSQGRPAPVHPQLGTPQAHRMQASRTVTSYCCILHVA